MNTALHADELRGTALRALNYCVAVAAMIFLTSSCNGTIVGPDSLGPTGFQALLVNGQSLPARAYANGINSSVWIKSAQLVTGDIGRTIDPRIFEDRTGGGQSAGANRETSAISAHMIDIRIFEIQDAAGIREYRDSSSVNVERLDDMMILTRDGPVARLIVVDTAYFMQGKLVVPVHEWQRFGNPTDSQFIYSVIK